MISLCQTDAAFRRVQHYNPDLNIGVLFIDEAELYEDDFPEITQVRTALVARVADIARQAAHEPQAFRAAVATIEVLISSYTNHDERPGRGHKHALQAIQLLASVPDRFNTVVDLFFDLVERFWTLNRSQSRVQGYTPAYTDSFVNRMMQNYDQTLVKLISKHWSAGRPVDDWDIKRPLDRIRTIRETCELHDDSSTRSGPRFRLRRTSPALFCESLRMLRGVQRTTLPEMVQARVAGYISRPCQLKVWARCVSMHLSPSTVEHGKVEFVDARWTTARRKIPQAGDEHQTITRMDAEITDLKEQVQMLCSVIEKSAHSKLYRGEDSHIDSSSSYTLTDDSDSLHDDEKLGHIKIYHAL